jgi:glycosyltransferase involved in cell wall biosynthesis
MMQGERSIVPKVSIGMPVYNGERFLRETLDSLLGQTFEDFELIISDNGSTDGTQTMCREYAARDSRIRYHREEINRGAGWNYNRVVDLARGVYFKWAAHDDLCAPTYLERCVEVLDRDPAVILTYPDDIDIDEKGNRINRKRASHIPSRERGSSPDVAQRFRRLVLLDYDCEEVFGLVRLDILRRTKLILNYADSDRTLLGELGLYGPFYGIPDPLFYHRHHSGSSGQANPIKAGWHLRAAWFDPRLKGRVLFPQWRQLLEYVKAVFHAPLGMTVRMKCLFWLGVGYRKRLGELAQELVAGVGRKFSRAGSPRKGTTDAAEAHG